VDVVGSVWYPVKAFGLFAAIVTIAWTQWKARPPFSTFGLANRITVGRAFLVSLAAGAIGEPARPDIATAAVALGVMASALDGVDGLVARRTQMTSAFGARFDMEVDALLIQVLAILVWQYGKAGAWILASGLLRYLFVAAGWIWTWMRAPLPPTFRGKIICVVQTVALLMALWPDVTPPASVFVSAAGLGVLSYSFLIDTIWLWTHADQLGEPSPS
jgi:phosphatidylglycerophosphate synthase